MNARRLRSAVRVDARPFLVFAVLLGTGAAVDRVLDGLLSVLVTVLLTVLTVGGVFVARTTRSDRRVNADLGARWEETLLVKAAEARAEREQATARRDVDAVADSEAGAA